MNKREAAFQTKFNRWLKYEYKRKRVVSSAFELKSATSSALPFAEVRLHQKESLLAAKHSRMVYKIPDDSIGYKPFDCFVLDSSAAFIVVQYPSGVFYLVDIDAWCAEESTSKRRSLTEERAKEIAEIVGAFRGRAKHGLSV